MSDLKKIKEDFLSKIKSKINLKKLNEIRLDLFGKEGPSTSQFKKIGSINESERKKFATDLNLIKDELNNSINLKTKEIEIDQINLKLEKKKLI